MSTIYSTATTLRRLESDGAFDEAQLAAAAFLARYSGHTLDAYRYDLRAFFQWSADVGLTVLAATRPHIELYRAAMEDITSRRLGDTRLGVPRLLQWPVVDDGDAFTVEDLASLR